MSCERRLRVLALIDQASGNGGAERFATGLARALPADRFESWMCGTRGGPDVPEGTEIDGVRFLTLRRRGAWDVRPFLSLLRLMRRERFDVVHSHMFGSNVWGSLFGRALGVPVIIAHEHNWSYTGQRYRMWLDRWLVGTLATRFVAVSELNRRRMIELEHIAPAKITTLPTAYIPHRANPGLDVRAELGLPADAPLVAVAAHQREEKSLDVLVRAHATVVRRVPDAHLLLVGDGPTREKLRALVATLGLGDRVHFLGTRDDVTAILGQVQVGALSSDWEGMPLFILECMSIGAAVVTTRVGGLVDMIDDGRTGRLVPPQDPSALGDAIADLLLDEVTRGRLVAAAREQVSELSMESVANRFVELYEELCASATSAARNTLRVQHVS